MGGVKMDILWSPNHEDKFVTFGTDLFLYKIDTCKDGPPKSQATKLSDDTYASLLSVNSDHQFIKCLAWYPKPSPDHLLAVGLANGKVVLTSFGKGGPNDPHGLIGKEFVPRHARQCNHLAWNPVESNLLAEGLDKYRADLSILIWDVNSKAPSELGPERRLSTMSVDPNAISKPYYEFGPSETALSLSWFPQDPKTLVTGMNHKYLKIIDLRDIGRPRSVAYTKAVYGVCVDPHFDYRLASFVEGQVSIWDTRNFDKPVLTLQDQRAVTKVSWSPTRSGLLGVLHRESPIVRLYDIQNTSVGSDELEPVVIERIVQPFKQHTVSSFDWHSKQENRLLSITPTGVIKDMQIFERIALNWSPGVSLSWACGRQLVQCATDLLSSSAEDDISVKMKNRALKGYGLQSDNLWQNGDAEFVGDNLQLRSLWHWLNHVRSLQETEESTSRIPAKGAVVRYIGVRSLLVGDVTGNLLHSELEYLHWQGLDTHKGRTPKRFYKSEERSRALELCGWGYDQDSFGLGEILKRIDREGDPERAAAIALFNLQMKYAVDILNSNVSKRKHSSGSSVNLSVVAMALSGFTDEKNTLWREMCMTQGMQLDNPYLRAMFAFLTAEGDNYDEVLISSGMDVIDQVAFACMYLPDAKLCDFTQKLTARLIEQGNLDGILLTGITKEGLDLLSRYVDKTGDVQTTALVSLQGFPLTDITRDERVNNWIDAYRGLLDTWRLWHQRAEFDVYRSGCEQMRPPQQVFVSCNFCGKSIAYNMLASRNRHFMYGTTTSLKPKITSCASCRKPLPRCALCLTNMGTAAGTGKTKPGLEDESEKLSPFSNWFTWCQSCRHGGHAQHMMAWFKDHLECPVTGCTCRCDSLDSMGQVPSDNSHITNPGH